MFVAVCVKAQVNVVDAGGQVCQDGGVMELHATSLQIAPGIAIPHMPSPTLVNTSDQAVKVALDYVIRQLPEGTTFADCFSGVCENYKETGAHTTATKEIAANSSLESQIEWGYQNVEGTCIVDFTLYVDGKKSISFTAKYINGSTDGVKGVASQAAQRSATYTLDGKRVNENAKGVVVRNGKLIIKK